jgi:hypothetical protein
MLVILMGGTYMEYVVERGSVGVIYIQSSVTTSSGIQIILMLLPQQFERLQFW